MRKYYLFIVSVFLLALSNPAQGQGGGYFKAGYQVGYMNPADINRVIYIYNKLHYNLDKKMPKMHFMHGYTVGFAVGGDTKLECFRTSRRAMVTAEQGDTVRQLRLISNFISMGVSKSIDKRWDVGVSLDVGNFKGFGRVGPKDNLPKFDRLFVVSNKSLLATTQLGSTIFVQRNFGFVAARLFYQFQIINMSLDNLDPWMLGGPIVEFDALDSGKASNVGLELMFRIGKFRNN
jgi:hypothetical protein